MSLMQLSPESQRLRKVVKAYAAGEMSQQAYREIRAEVVHEFGNPEAFRTDEDATEQRRTANKSRSQSGRAVVRSSNLRWTIALVVLAVLSLVFSERQVFALDVIPGVNERDPNPANSLRFDVSGFYVENFTDLDGLSLSEEKVNAFLTAQYSSLKTQSDIKSHGFTERELVELASYLQSLSVHERKTGISQAESEALVALVQSQKSRRGLSLVQLEQVANNLARLYRDSGMPVTVAFIPAQKVDERVAFTVLPGELEAVNIGGGRQLKNVRLEKQFSGLLNQAVKSSEIESALFLINDLPGLDVQANFIAGEALGTTQLQLMLNDVQTWTSRLSLDNQGDRETGLQRAMAVSNWNNPTNRGDRIQLGILHSWNSGDSDRGYLDYQLPVFDLATTVNLGFSNSGFEFDDVSPQMGNGSRILRLSMKRVMRRSRNSSWNFRLGSSLQHLELEEPGGSGRESQKLWYFLGALETDLVSDTYKTRSNIRLEVDLGNISSGALAGQDNTFWRARLNSELERLIVVPGMPGLQELTFSLVGQLSNSLLPVSMEMGLGGGDNRVNGFYRSDFSADSGLHFGSELRLFPQRPLGSFVLIAGVAFGKHHTQNTNINGRMSSVGVGWDVSLLQGQLNGKLRWSFPLASSNNIRQSSSRLLWSMEYQIK